MNLSVQKKKNFKETGIGKKHKVNKGHFLEKHKHEENENILSTRREDSAFVGTKARMTAGILHK